MPISAKDLKLLMDEVELEDPIDFGDIPYSEAHLREIVASSLSNMALSMEKFDAEDRYITLLAATGKLVLENLVLNIKLLTRDGQPIGPEVEALFSRLRKGDQA